MVTTCYALTYLKGWKLDGHQLIVELIHVRSEITKLLPLYFKKTRVKSASV